MDQDNQQISQSTGTVSSESVNNFQTTPSTNWLASLLFLISGILIGSGSFWLYQGYFYQPPKSPTVSPSPSLSPTKKEISEEYTVSYPQNFYITAKNIGYFSVADNKFLGNFTHIPEASIQVYTNVIPVGMDLTTWVNGISDPSPPVGPQPPKSCKDFIDQLKNQLKYGDLIDGQNRGDNCWYFGLSGIKSSIVAGIPALSFQTENVSEGATHTIFKYKNPSGNISLIDIYYTVTGQSDANDKTADAYNSFISTFSPKDPQ